MSDYIYSISSDFPNHAVAPDRLTQEIQQSAIITALDCIRTAGDVCTVTFKAVLSAGDETILDGLVAAHLGVPLAVPPTKTVLTTEQGSDVSVEPDGRMVVVNFPADEGSYMWLCGAGDDVVNQLRGKGQKLQIKFADVTRETPETQYVDIRFLEQVQLHDGHMEIKTPAQWDIDDTWDFSIHMAETAVTENVTSTGNCNVVNPQGQPGQPDSYIVVPAAGDGAYDVDLATATPVPASGAGFWAYDVFSDTLTPSSTPGQASWHVLLVPLDAYFMRSMPIPQSPTGVFDFDAYKAERIGPRWVLRLSATKVSNGPGALTGWLVVFRDEVT